MKTNQRIKLENQLEILVAWEAGERVQCKDNNNWLDIDPPTHPEAELSFGCKIRINPKPREVWIVGELRDSYSSAFASKFTALEFSKLNDHAPVAKFVEVLE